jgi:hypothetical protein
MKQNLGRNASTKVHYLLGMVKTLEIIVTLTKTLLRNIGRSITLVEFLPEMEASSTT